MTRQPPSSPSSFTKQMLMSVQRAPPRAMLRPPVLTWLGGTCALVKQATQGLDKNVQVGNITVFISYYIYVFFFSYKYGQKIILKSIFPCLIKCVHIRVLTNFRRSI